MRIRTYVLPILPIVCFACLLFEYLRPGFGPNGILSGQNSKLWGSQKLSSIRGQGSIFRFNSSDTPYAYMKGNLWSFSEAQICSERKSQAIGERFDAIILIPSRFEDIERRQIIRDTWANKLTYHRPPFYQYQTLFVVRDSSKNY